MKKRLTLLFAIFLSAACSKKSGNVTPQNASLSGTYKTYKIRDSIFSGTDISQVNIQGATADTDYFNIGASYAYMATNIAYSNTLSYRLDYALTFTSGTNGTVTENETNKYPFTYDSNTTIFNDNGKTTPATIYLKVSNSNNIELVLSQTEGASVVLKRIRYLKKE